MLKKRFVGDTLIEVMFAAGIFSMVAISVVALMNNSTAKIQSALESTMTRNEIDSEAEALRFIQSSYVAEISVKAPVKTYSALWEKIKAQATDDESVTTFAPHSCAELYEENGEAKKHGFILNYRNLYAEQGTELNPASVLQVGSENPQMFTEALLYPRLMFNNRDDLYAGTNIAKNLTAAEGIYVVAVKDIAKTNVVDATGVKGASAFFDFYIRSCWQAPGSDVPTLVSTVIRLYDPDVAK
ncbi:hypothetical protein IKT64_00420 [Candidatus Saccharibacteria bacterium]|nr:hypothetical protein [Candidatus Saccharibacteria bacterium]